MFSVLWLTGLSGLHAASPAAADTRLGPGYTSCLSSPTGNKNYKVSVMKFLFVRVCDIRLTQKMDCREKTCWSPDYYDEDTPVALTMLETEYDNENPKLLEPSEEYCKVEMYSP